MYIYSAIYVRIIDYTKFFRKSKFALNRTKSIKLKVLQMLAFQRYGCCGSRWYLCCFSCSFWLLFGGRRNAGVDFEWKWVVIFRARAPSLTRDFFLFFFVKIMWFILTVETHECDIKNYDYIFLFRQLWQTGGWRIFTFIYGCERVQGRAALNEIGILVCINDRNRNFGLV